jgi:hypothetical protein
MQMVAAIVAPTTSPVVIRCSMPCSRGSIVALPSSGKGRSLPAWLHGNVGSARSTRNL